MAEIINMADTVRKIPESVISMSCENLRLTSYIASFSRSGTNPTATAIMSAGSIFPENLFHSLNQGFDFDRFYQIIINAGLCRAGSEVIS